jgi:hypothetical protein
MLVMVDMSRRLLQECGFEDEPTYACGYGG